MSICENCSHQNSKSLPLSPSRSFTTQNLSTAEQRSALATIQSEIARHKTYLKRLEEEESALEASLALVVYPVLTLPAEITSWIFVNCLPTHGRVIPSPSTAPLLGFSVLRAQTESHYTGDLATQWAAA
ncbi:hypothetical protein C8R44DRAFT_746984 [Mycena epipterygia]|nr:hypothetical protein C8R44DRAFT_746984 [Mycena epipterygia]